MSFCKTDILGYVATDPELKQTSEGKSYANFLLIANGKNDKKTPLNVTAWGYGAENVSEAGKGALVFATGELEAWQKTEKDPLRFSLNAFRVEVPRQPGTYEKKEYKNDTKKTKGTNKEDDLPF